MSQIKSIYGRYITKVEDIHISLPNDNILRSIVITRDNQHLITYIQHIPGNNYTQGLVNTLIESNIPGQYMVCIYDERYLTHPEICSTFTLHSYNEHQAMIGLLNLH